MILKKIYLDWDIIITYHIFGSFFHVGFFVWRQKTKVRLIIEQ